MLLSYFTVKNEGTDELVIQKSRFITSVQRVETEQDAQEFIQKIKQQHPNANHNCSAYCIGAQDQIQKANDDGEPSGTAGVPILECIKKQKLKDTAIVVTRYFGGIKLGAGGLIRAYGSAASLGVNTTGIVKRQLMQGFSITVDYTLLGKLENTFRNSNHILESINYLENVEFIIYAEKPEAESFKDWVVDLTNNQAVITETKLVYQEIDVDSTKE